MCGQLIQFTTSGSELASALQNKTPQRLCTLWFKNRRPRSASRLLNVVVFVVHGISKVDVLTALHLVLTAFRVLSLVLPIHPLFSAPLSSPLRACSYYCEIWSGPALPSWNFNEHWSAWLRGILQALVVVHLFIYCLICFTCFDPIFWRKIVNIFVALLFFQGKVSSVPW